MEEMKNKTEGVAEETVANPKESDVKAEKKKQKKSDAELAELKKQLEKAKESDSETEE